MEVSLGAGGAATCRCCLAPGVAAKDLSSEYDFMGEKEVYADMLLESFDITLSRAVNAGWVICDSCITRLRDSSNFKKQVLHSEKCLLQKSKAGVASTEDVAESKLELTVLKQEEDSDDDHADFETLFYDEEDHNELKKPVVKTEPLASTSNDMSNDEDVPLSSLTAGVKRKARPIKTDTLPKYLRVGPKQLKDPPVRLKVLPAASAKTAPKAPLPRPAVKVGGIKVQLAKESAQKLATSKLSGRQLKITLKNPSTAAVKKGIYDLTMEDCIRPVAKANPGVAKPKLIPKDQLVKANTTLLLEYSTVCPFKWRGNSSYRCFYCPSQFLDPEQLRQHTSSVHKNENIKTFVKRIRKEQHVKIDIATIRCKLCSEQFGTIDNLKQHLIHTHNQKFYEGSGDGVLPFKLSIDKFDCQFCPESLRTFHLLNQHMNKHFTDYICDSCGNGFLSHDRLARHRKIHEEGSFECKMCEKVFPTAGKRDAHIHYYHKSIKIQCPQCHLTFKDTIKREVHLIRVHNAEHLKHKCESCEMVFVRKGRLSEHIRKVHLHERNYKCELCDYSCFSKIELKNHFVRHTKERSHVCKVCKKGFGRRKTMKIHMRLHFNDRRYACKTCGLAFFQSCSLKTHMKKHQ